MMTECGTAYALFVYCGSLSQVEELEEALEDQMGIIYDADAIRAAIDQAKRQRKAYKAPTGGNYEIQESVSGAVIS